MSKSYIVADTKAFSASFNEPPTILNLTVHELDENGDIIKAAGYIYTLSIDEITNLEILLENAMIAYQGENGFV